MPSRFGFLCVFLCVVHLFEYMEGFLSSSSLDPWFITQTISNSKTNVTQYPFVVFEYPSVCMYVPMIRLKERKGVHMLIMPGTILNKRGHRKAWQFWECIMGLCQSEMDFEHVLVIVNKRGHRKRLDDGECTYMARIDHHVSAWRSPCKRTNSW